MGEKGVEDQVMKLGTLAAEKNGPELQTDPRQVKKLELGLEEQVLTQGAKQSKAASGWGSGSSLWLWWIRGSEGQKASFKLYKNISNATGFKTTSTHRPPPPRPILGQHSNVKDKESNKDKTGVNPNTGLRAQTGVQIARPYPEHVSRRFPFTPSLTKPAAGFFFFSFSLFIIYSDKQASFCSMK